MAKKEDSLLSINTKLFKAINRSSSFSTLYNSLYKDRYKLINEAIRDDNICIVCITSYISLFCSIPGCVYIVIEDAVDKISDKICEEGDDFVEIMEKAPNIFKRIFAAIARFFKRK